LTTLDVLRDPLPDRPYDVVHDSGCFHHLAASPDHLSAAGPHDLHRLIPIELRAVHPDRENRFAPDFLNAALFSAPSTPDARPSGR
jgi:hypothetical protein